MRMLWFPGPGVRERLDVRQDEIAGLRRAVRQDELAQEGSRLDEDRDVHEERARLDGGRRHERAVVRPVVVDDAVGREGARGGRLPHLDPAVRHAGRVQDAVVLLPAPGRAACRRRRRSAVAPLPSPETAFTSTVTGWLGGVEDGHVRAVRAGLAEGVDAKGPAPRARPGRSRRTRGRPGPPGCGAVVAAAVRASTPTASGSETFVNERRSVPACCPPVGDRRRRSGGDRR